MCRALPPPPVWVRRCVRHRAWVTAHQVAGLRSPPGAHLPKKMPSSQPHASHTAGLRGHKASKQAGR